MSSIRRRLFAILMGATGVVWLSALLWLQYSTRSDLQRVLDRRLEESAHMVASLIVDGGLSADAAARAGAAVAAAEEPSEEGPVPALPGNSHRYARQLSCQVWGLDGRLIGESTGGPGTRLTGEATGFSENAAGGEVWRVYSLVEPKHRIRVMVGDAMSMRARLLHGVMLGLLVPALLGLPFIAALIWWAVARGLAPLDRLAAGLARRPATDLSPVPDLSAPAELRPMIRALNDLFGRVTGARERERDFTAFAAHELKTPLAGIKTQAQIAAIAPDAETRKRALTQLVGGVDRTDRMVRQLLDMTAVEHDPAGARERKSGWAILAAVTGDLCDLAATRGVRIELAPEETAPGWKTAQGALLASALRNLIENAIHAAPRDSAVSAGMAMEGGRIRFRIEDRGPGIPEAERTRVTERFYRGAGSHGAGSGLGLAIVQAAMERMEGELRLSPRPGGGERAELLLPGDIKTTAT